MAWSPLWRRTLPNVIEAAVTPKTTTTTSAPKTTGSYNVDVVPPGGTWNPTTGVYTDPSGTKFSTPSAPPGSTIISPFVPQPPKPQGGGGGGGGGMSYLPPTAATITTSTARQGGSAGLIVTESQITKAGKELTQAEKYYLSAEGKQTGEIIFDPKTGEAVSATTLQPSRYILTTDKGTKTVEFGKEGATIGETKVTSPDISYVGGKGVYPSGEATVYQEYTGETVKGVPIVRTIFRDEYGQERLATAEERKQFQEGTRVWEASIKPTKPLPKVEQFLIEQREALKTQRQRQGGEAQPLQIGKEILVGAGTSVVSSVTFFKNLIKEPLPTIKSIPSGIKQSYQFVTSGKLSRVIKEEPGFVTGYVGAEIGQAYLGSKVSSKIINEIVQKKLPFSISKKIAGRVDDFEIYKYEKPLKITKTPLEKTFIDDWKITTSKANKYIELEFLEPKPQKVALKTFKREQRIMKAKTKYLADLQVDEALKQTLKEIKGSVRYEALKRFKKIELKEAQKPKPITFDIDTEMLKGKMDYAKFLSERETKLIVIDKDLIPRVVEMKPRFKQKLKTKIPEIDKPLVTFDIISEGKVKTPLTKTFAEVKPLLQEPLKIKPPKKFFTIKNFDIKETGKVILSGKQVLIQKQIQKPIQLPSKVQKVKIKINGKVFMSGLQASLVATNKLLKQQTQQIQQKERQGFFFPLKQSQVFKQEQKQLQSFKEPQLQKQDFRQIIKQIQIQEYGLKQPQAQVILQIPRFKEPMLPKPITLLKERKFFPKFKEKKLLLKKGKEPSYRVLVIEKKKPKLIAKGLPRWAALDIGAGEVLKGLKATFIVEKGNEPMMKDIKTRGEFTRFRSLFRQPRGKSKFKKFGDVYIQKQVKVDGLGGRLAFPGEIKEIKQARKKGKKKGLKSMEKYLK